MNGIDSPPALWIWALVQVAGFASALLARVSEGSSRQTLGHGFFFACLAMVGTATTIALAMGPGYWLTSATTLAAMILMATCDFRRSEQMLAS